MTTDIIVPTLGESVTEATVAKWFKSPGDAVVLPSPIASAAALLSSIDFCARETMTPPFDSFLRS